MQNLSYIKKDEGILTKKNAKLFLNIVILILIMGGLVLFLNRNNIKADSDLGTFKSEKEFNLILNNKKFRFTVKSYSKNGNDNNYLFQRDFFRIKQTQLFGFEDEYNLCSKPTLKLKDKEIICLVGDVGVHSQAISLVRQDLSLVKINNNVSTNYLTSDVPNYQIQDYNNDSYDDLIVDDRDYDKNPMIDVVRRYYSGGPTSFIFDKEERVEVQ